VAGIPCWARNSLLGPPCCLLRHGRWQHHQFVSQSQPTNTTAAAAWAAMAAPAPRWSTRLGHVAQHTVATGPAAAGVSAGIGSFRLDGRVAVITGGARHFGLEIAHALGSAGCSLVVTSRTAESAEAAARALASAHSVDTIGLPLDVSVAEDVERMSAQAIAWKGHVDVLVNNAGGGSGPSAPVGGIFERDITAAETLLRANLLGSYLTCKAFGRHMAERGYGKIINIGSISGLLGRDDRMYVNNGMERQPIDCECQSMAWKPTSAMGASPHHPPPPPPYPPPPRWVASSYGACVRAGGHAWPPSCV
jgi:NAD(P)-dependent dehydrogenase (short-subunit alcohol dehydrogenase family)